MIGVRPLVIIHVGGGLVQSWTTKPGTGEPDLHILDYDREGAEPNELNELADAIDAAVAALETRALSDLDRAGIAEMRQSAIEYREYAADGESPGRYR